MNSLAIQALLLATPFVPEAMVEVTSTQPLEYDVVFFDNVSSVYVEDTPDKKGIGGSELGVITLSKELAAAGFSVLVLNDPLVLKCTSPSPHEPIVSPSGVHYASCRGELPAISCGTLIIQRSSVAPDSIKRDRAVVWLHDACSGPQDPNAGVLAEATSKPLNKSGASPIFVSSWQRDTYPRNAVGRYSRVIPNIVPRILYEDRWKSVQEEDTMVFASAALRGLDATLKAWSDSRVARAGKTVLEVMGPVYDPPPPCSSDLRAWKPELEGRVRLVGSLPLPCLAERMAASRGLLFVNTWPETFCLLVAYAEALGKPARFVAMSPDGVGGVGDTMVNKSHLYARRDWDRFLTDLAAEIAGPVVHVEPVRKFHPENVMPMWYDALGLAP